MLLQHCGTLLEPHLAAVGLFHVEALREGVEPEERERHKRGGDEKFCKVATGYLEGLAMRGDSGGGEQVEA